MDKNETSRAENASGRHAWTVCCSTPRFEIAMNETNFNLASPLPEQKQWMQKTNNTHNIFPVVRADGLGSAVRV